MRGGVEAELDALLLEEFLQRQRHLAVAGDEDLREEFEDGDLGPEARPDGAHLDADVAATDDDHLFREFGERERFGRADDVLSVER